MKSFGKICANFSHEILWWKFVHIFLMKSFGKFVHIFPANFLAKNCAHFLPWHLSAKFCAHFLPCGKIYAHLSHEIFWQKFVHFSHEIFWQNLCAIFPEIFWLLPQPHIHWPVKLAKGPDKAIFLFQHGRSGPHWEELPSLHWPKVWKIEMHRVFYGTWTFLLL